MQALRLSKLPDRNPVKITITVQPDLHAALRVYAELYRESYGDEESVAELIPYMLQTFLETDRGFARAMKERETGDASTPSFPRVGRRNGREESSPKS